ncbi:hypothetical protein JD276_05080 [Leucobacter sp. CSA1]|uniref:D-3-phosphoglycerate dehydrogenase n=1 Tax=Leucobacter chromiisoli TaxID=2796471 RepID=A0A934Q676_9MICO|nr:NAD(P)-dependent oxidoreductase [Leucobacter chromiisoli]MBK0418406.1 hypothetical protein [Leucobacter chromiisoli]
MTSHRILITAPFDDARLAELAEGHAVTGAEPLITGGSLADRGLTDRGIADALSEVEVIVAELDRIDRATLDAAPRLRLVISCHANPVNVDLAACAERGVVVAATPGRNAAVTADFSFALLLATVRRLSESERWLRAGSWSPDDVFEPYETFRSIGLSGRTLGIVGGGAVGRRVMRRALGFDMEVQVYDPFLPEDAFGGDARIVDLPTLMSTSDIVSVHAPLTPETRGLIGAEELAMLQPTAYLINAGRAALIEEEPLMRMLREGRIAGAGFDVFYDEPLSPDSELFDFANVTLTPHIAGASDDVVLEHSRIAVEIFERWAAGETVPHAWTADGPVR